MAKKDDSFPAIAESNWWKLRDLFLKTVPNNLTSTYLASALSMTELSAKTNIITPLKKIGLIDGGGKPTKLAYDWRDDKKYPDVCKKIYEQIYPKELRELVNSQNFENATLLSWIMNHCQCGKNAATKCAQLYTILLNADLLKRNKMSGRKGDATKKPTDKTKNTTVKEENKKVKTNKILSNEDSIHIPTIHINLQIHIAPESPAEQIDKIFESMAKHLKGFMNSW
jgi:hypothetical protein